VGVWRDPDAEYVNAHTGEIGTIRENAEYLLEHPYPWSQPTMNLLYKYFGVDPVKLEKERIALLVSLR